MPRPRSALLPLLLLAACTDDPAIAPDAVKDVLDLPETPYGYSAVTLPAHYRSPAVAAMDNTPADNPITDAGATLGRVLFHDKRLSKDQTVACVSCHVQANAFADPRPFSRGVAGETTRNAMHVTDARFYRSGRFFWDERAATLEDQVLLPIQNQVEMGMTLPELVTRLDETPYYGWLFEQAFGDPTITEDRIAKALAQFSRTLTSYRSRYDEGLAAAGDVAARFPSFTAEEEQGKQLFLGRAGCAACHLDSGPPRPGPRPNQAVFFIDIATVNGIDATTTGVDNGVGAVSGVRTDDGRFKSPSLRNVAVTAPYMHDGRFATLEEVVEHYRRGVQQHPNLDPRLRVPGGAARNVDLTDAEARALVAFLHTLTDDALLADPWFADPFRAE